LYSILTYRAIKKTPVGQGAIALSCLLPISLMQLTAYGYDSAVLTITINYFVSIFILDNKNKFSNKRDIIEGLFWSFLLGAVKGGGYVILFPIVFMLVIGAVNLKHTMYIAASILLSAFSLLINDYLLQDHSSKFFQLGGENANFYSAAFAWHNPIVYLQMLIRTFLKDIDDLSLSMLGRALGWNENVTPIILLVGLLLAIIVYSIYEYKAIIFTKGKKLSLFISILMVLLFTPIMLLSNTPKESPTIIGLQGRYFLPVLPLIILIISEINSKMIKLDIEKKKFFQHQLAMQSYCLMAFSILSSIVVCFLLKVYLTR
jgi:uncharacterized membrane protein